MCAVGNVRKVVVCCVYCGEKCVRVYGSVSVCCVYCREQCVSAVGNVRKVVVCCAYCREQCVCAVRISISVLLVL